MTESPLPRPRCPRRLKAAGVTFTPVPIERLCHNGWSPARQQRFLAALYACGIVATAAEAAGMSARSAYRLRARAGAESFAAAWDRLLREARTRAFDQAMESALGPGFVPRRYRGLFIGKATANNERMVLAALRACRFGEPILACAATDAEKSHFPSGKSHK
jgi:hypothetical protein